MILHLISPVNHQNEAAARVPLKLVLKALKLPVVEHDNPLHGIH